MNIGEQKSILSSGTVSVRCIDRWFHHRSIQCNHMETLSFPPILFKNFGKKSHNLHILTYC